MSFDLQYRSYGRDAILIQWPQEADDEIFFDILAFRNQIMAEAPSWLGGTIPASNSLCLIVHENVDSVKVQHDLDEIYKRRSSEEVHGKSWKIPVCYDDDGSDTSFAPDLKSLSQKCEMEEQEIIQRHSTLEYLVQFHGFLPGFVYLGGLDKLLHCRRRTHPRIEVSKGSVGIGGSQTGIYAINSPGGWNIIGRTPLPIFDSNSESPTYFNPGDQLRFVQIDRSEFEQIKLDIRNTGFIAERWIR